MADRYPIEERLPEEYERHRARFMGMTFKHFKALQGHLAMMRNRYRPERPPPSNQRSHKPSVKQSSTVTMFPFDESEFGQRRKRRAEEAIANVVAGAKKLGVEARKQIRLRQRLAGRPVLPDDESPQDPHSAA